MFYLALFPSYCRLLVKFSLSTMVYTLRTTKFGLKKLET